MEKNYTLRRQRSAETITKLKESAVELINERGYNNVTIDDICENCGYSKGAFYHHFKSKIDIVSALEADVNHRLEAELEALAGEDVLIKLETVNRVMLSGATENGFEILRERCIYNLGGEYAKTSGSESYAVMSKEIVRSVLEDAVAEKQLRDDTPIEDLLELIMVLFTGTLCDWSIYNGEFDIKEKSSHIFGLMIRSIVEKYRA